MKLPSFRRLFTEDYPKEYKKLIDLLSVSVNNGIEVVYSALNNGLTFVDNIKGTQKDVLVTVDGNGYPLQITAFTLNSTAKVLGTVVILAQNQTNTANYPTSGVMINGAQSGNTYIINNVTGLQANQQYLLRIQAQQS